MAAGNRALRLHKLSSRWGRFKIVRSAIYSLNLALHGVEIEAGAEIGRGILLPHPTGVVIGNRTVIEDYVYIGAGVLFGYRMDTTPTPDGHPTIKRGAWIGAHAAILGPIVIGEGAYVAAGAVVVADVRPGWLVAGVPAKHLRLLDPPISAVAGVGVLGAGIS